MKTFLQIARNLKSCNSFNYKTFNKVLTTAARQSENKTKQIKLAKKMRNSLLS